MARSMALRSKTKYKTASTPTTTTDNKYAKKSTAKGNMMSMAKAGCK